MPSSSESIALIITEPRTRSLNGTQAGPDLKRAVRDYVRAYGRLHGRRKTAEYLGVSRHTLWRFLERGHMGRAVPSAVLSSVGGSVGAIEAATLDIIIDLEGLRPDPALRHLRQGLEEALSLLYATPLATVRRAVAPASDPATWKPSYRPANPCDMSCSSRPISKMTAPHSLIIDSIARVLSLTLIFPSHNLSDRSHTSWTASPGRRSLDSEAQRSRHGRRRINRRLYGAERLPPRPPIRRHGSPPTGPRILATCPVRVAPYLDDDHPLSNNRLQREGSLSYFPPSQSL